MQLRWVAAASPNALHAAAAIALDRPIIDDGLAAALGEPAARLRELAAAQRWPLDALVSHLLPLSIGIENNRELAEVTIGKLVGRQQSSAAQSQLAAVISGIEAAMLRVRPDAVAELATRSLPLREQWEARGPGVLTETARLCPREFLVEAADVALVLPILGGGGAAHVLYNSVRLEAVLANPRGELPEVCRLAWLLAQLQLDRPDFQGELPRAAAFALGAFALLPLVLSAAAEVELVRLDGPLLGVALESWIGADLPATQLNSAEVANRLLAWHDVYADRRPPWPAAVAALGQMLASPPAA